MFFSFGRLHNACKHKLCILTARIEMVRVGNAKRIKKERFPEGGKT